MKGFFAGLTTGLVASVAAQFAMASKHEEIAETIKNIDLTTCYRTNKKASLEDLLERKRKLEELIVKKQSEQNAEDIAETTTFTSAETTFQTASDDPFETT